MKTKYVYAFVAVIGLFMLCSACGRDEQSPRSEPKLAQFYISEATYLSLQESVRKDGIEKEGWVRLKTTSNDKKYRVELSLLTKNDQPSIFFEVTPEKWSKENPSYTFNVSQNGAVIFGGDTKQDDVYRVIEELRMRLLMNMDKKK